MLAEDVHRIVAFIATDLEPFVWYSHNPSHIVHPLGLCLGGEEVEANGWLWIVADERVENNEAVLRVFLTCVGFIA